MEWGGRGEGGTGRNLEQVVDVGQDNGDVITNEALAVVDFIFLWSHGHVPEKGSTREIQRGERESQRESARVHKVWRAICRRWFVSRV